MTALSGWESFYVIVGSSAGALIGLQFVVITLIANRPTAPGQAQAGDAFATDVHQVRNEWKDAMPTIYPCVAVVFVPEAWDWNLRSSALLAPRKEE